MQLISPLCKGKLSAAFLTLFFLIVYCDVHAQTCNPNNFAANKNVTASPSSSQGNAANVTDGNLSTDWFTDNTGDKSVTIDLTTNTSLCKAILKWGYWTNVPDFIVQGSTNGTTWVDLVSVPAVTPGLHAPDNSYDYSDVDLSNISTSYRYIRIYFSNNGAWGPHLKEVEIYAKDVIQLPDVTITSPSTGANFSQGSNIAINTTATVQGSTISKVEFFQGDTKLGEVVSAPYNFTWNNVPAGDYSIVAKAWSAAGQSNVANISISVAAAGTSSAGWSFTGNAGTSSTAFLGTTDSKPLIVKTNGIERMRILADGRIGIKTDKFPTDDPSVALAVGGNIQARKLKVTQSTWADYVFHKNYKLPTFKELEDYINKHHHLPDVPSAGEVEKNGLDLGNSQALLLQKIEELTLYMIQVNNKVEKLERENANLKTQLNRKK